MTYSGGSTADSLGKIASAMMAPSALAARAADTCGLLRISDTDATLCARSARRPSSRKTLAPRLAPRQATTVSMNSSMNSRSAAAPISIPANSGMGDPFTDASPANSEIHICKFPQVSECRHGQVVAGGAYPHWGDAVRPNTYRNFGTAVERAFPASIPQARFSGKGA